MLPPPPFLPCLQGCQGRPSRILVTLSECGELGGGGGQWGSLEASS